MKTLRGNRISLKQAEELEEELAKIQDQLTDLSDYVQELLDGELSSDERLESTEEAIASAAELKELVNELFEALKV